MSLNHDENAEITNSFQLTSNIARESEKYFEEDGLNSMNFANTEDSSFQIDTTNKFYETPRRSSFANKKKGKNKGVQYPDEELSKQVKAEFDYFRRQVNDELNSIRKDFNTQIGEIVHMIKQLRSDVLAKQNAGMTQTAPPVDSSLM